MTKYQPYLDFTAQSHNVSSLMRLYTLLQNHPDAKPPLTAFVVFIAFAIESYINSVGSRKIDFWNEIERLSWRKKLEILHNHSGNSSDWGGEPLQFAVEVFRLRDNLAHGKPERVFGPAFDDYSVASDALSSSHLKPDWFASITESWVIESKDRFRKLMIYIATLYGLGEFDHLLHSSGSFIHHDA